MGFYRKIPEAVRFLEKVSPCPNTGCWLWDAVTKSNGYGAMSVGVNGAHTMSRKRMVYAHRLSYELHKGPIPEGQCVLHKCDVPSCVNPDHLWAGSQIENLEDCRAKGRARGRFSK